MELTESKTVSIDFDKANSLSSDEGMSTHGMLNLKKVPQNSPTKFKGTNTLNVQPLHHLGQSLPNLNLNQITISNNTLLVPGTSGQSNLLSPSHRGISYPPPSPTRYVRIITFDKLILYLFGHKRLATKSTLRNGNLFCF